MNEGEGRVTLLLPSKVGGWLNEGAGGGSPLAVIKTEGKEGAGTLSSVRSGSGPARFCGPWTRTSRSGPLNLDLDPVHLRPGPGGPVQVRFRFGPGLLRYIL